VACVPNLLIDHTTNWVLWHEDLRPKASRRQCQTNVIQPRVARDVEYVGDVYAARAPTRIVTDALVTHFTNNRPNAGARIKNKTKNAITICHLSLETIPTDYNGP
jgi:hypothetical protein